ncbi:MAG: site-specific integrase [Proteobacteria bacterium]|nr:site-specific integrase [Pseudomonadota bacterium]
MKIEGLENIVIVQDKKNREQVYGIYRPEGMSYGRNGIRKKLCSLEDAAFKNVKGGEHRRSEAEMRRHVKRLYRDKLREVLLEKENAKKPESMRVEAAGQLWLDYLAAKGRSPNTIKNYAMSLNRYVQAAGNHPLNRYKKTNYDIFLVAL